MSQSGPSTNRLLIVLNVIAGAHVKGTNKIAEPECCPKSQLQRFQRIIIKSDVTVHRCLSILPLFLRPPLSTATFFGEQVRHRAHGMAWFCLVYGLRGERYADGDEDMVGACLLGRYFAACNALALDRGCAVGETIDTGGAALSLSAFVSVRSA